MINVIVHIDSALQCLQLRKHINLERSVTKDRRQVNNKICSHYRVTCLSLPSPIHNKTICSCSNKKQKTNFEP